MKLSKNKVLTSLFLLTSLLWLGSWVLINLFKTGPSPDDFTDTYGIVALTGALLGLFVAKRWGGFSSKFGRSMSFFALGMFFQFLGQLIYTLYFRIGDVEAAFPSLGDIPYMLSNIFYIVGVSQLLSVICYPRKVYKPLGVMLVASVVTGITLVAMTKGFLSIAAQDERGTLYSALNLAYPLVQSIYFFIGIVALLQSKIIAGAKMFHAVALMLIALLMQFAADFSFLYGSYHETWKPAGVSELLYLIAYSLMGISIIMIDGVRRGLLKSPSSDKEAA